MTTTDRALVAAIAEIIAPNPHFREERRKRLGKPMDDAAHRDFITIRTAANKAARIVALVGGE
jgi:alkylhydroperoxidase family enzyme